MITDDFTESPSDNLSSTDSKQQSTFTFAPTTVATYTSKSDASTLQSNKRNVTSEKNCVTICFEQTCTTASPRNLGK